MIEALTAQTTTESPSLVTLLFVVLLSFVLSTALAYVYQKTYRGLSYSRTYVQSIVLISIISAMVIQAIGDSLARGLGIMAAMAIIRFRTNFKDPRDTLFLFASLAAGISCGAFAFVVAILGTLSFSLAAIILYYSPLGPDKYFDGMLRFNLKANCNDNKNLNAILQQHCRSFALVTVREMEQGMRVDYAYHIKLRRGVESTQLIQQMKSLETVQQVALMMQEATVDL
ncbi:MAG: DUF4956 domain-containing protein [Gammaproteobacteria bacterium]|nr:DUF4956 domain-containing protein [Gammaproteobacteria bacterium]MCB1881649.1 DUF4956 domain-containing protein [Gammaproteobacteria bacterium]